jgi:hypothetical protein
VARLPGDHDDETLLLADVGRKALRQVEAVVTNLLERHMEPLPAQELAHLLSSGVWTHDHPLMAADLAKLGLPVSVGIPQEERTLMELYPQPRGRDEAVEYAAWRRLPGMPVRRDSSSSRRANSG